MQFIFMSLFPGMFDGPLKDSILERARNAGIFSYQVVNPRDFSENPHRTVDDYSYGGGPGMLLEPGPFYRAHQAIKDKANGSIHTVMLTPVGRPFTQSDARRLSRKENLVFLCGHYEGMDERVTDLADEMISLGDFVLTGGELGAMVITDAVARMLPGVLGHECGAEDESFSLSLLEHPQYTRPPVYGEKEVPAVLLSGNHQEIEKWRRKQSLLRTLKCRPDLLPKVRIYDRDLKLFSINPEKWEDEK